MTELDKLLGGGNVDSEKIVNLVLEMNELDLHFDVRFIEDMEIAIVLDEVYKIAEKLKLNNAIAEIDNIEKQTKLLTFTKKRREFFDSQESELSILSTGMGEIVSLTNLAKEVFGWDKIDRNERYIKRKNSS